MPHPVTLIGTIKAHALQSFAFDFGRYLIAATLIAALVWVLRRTALKSRQIQKRTATAADIRREVMASFTTCLVYTAVSMFIIMGIQTGVLKGVNHSYGLWPDLALFGALVVAHDAYFYWVHRAMHHPLLFKRFHRLHHRSITPTPWAAYAFAAPEAVVMALFVAAWQFFVATPGFVLFSFLGFQIVRNAMGHAGVELHARWWLSTPLTRWINTTTHHDLHHSGGFNRNYGLYFTFWDRLMGTEHPDYHATFARVTAPETNAYADGLPSPAR